MKLDWQTIKRPIIALSPMADMTDSAFCRTVKSLCPDTIHLPLSPLSSLPPSPLIVFREMVSAEAVVRGNEKTLNMTDIHPNERPLVQQLFGSDPHTMAEAAHKIESEHHPEGFDINMGCPVYKIVHNFNGAALMKEPSLAYQIIQEVKKVITVPLSIKIRSGWDNPRECLEFGKVLQDAGADMITIHGRTKVQGYSGTADWEIIRELAEKLTIPVLANGDIHTAPLAIQALDQTQAEGVLIARGALGNPWIFQQIFDLLEGKNPTPISLQERVSVIKMHLDFHVEQHGVGSIPTFRKHLAWYLRGLTGVKPFKERLHTTLKVAETHRVLDELLCAEILTDVSDRDANHPLAGIRKYMAK